MTDPLFRPQIPQMEVEKAEALAGVQASQQARAKGYDPATIRALGAYGQSTRISEEVQLYPLCMQVQLCLMEHSQLFENGEDARPSTPTENLKRMTRLAFCFAEPEEAFHILTYGGEPAEIRREFEREAFRYMRHFQDPAAIDLLTQHIEKEMGILQAAQPKIPDTPQKKTAPAPRRTRPPRRR